MFENLNDIGEKRVSLEMQLSDPDVVSDQKKYQKLVREHSHVVKLDDLYNEYCTVCRDLEENEEILRNEGEDPELAELARAETQELTEKKAELEEILGLSIKRKELFEQALLHRSYLQVIDNNEVMSNERLEFLGDAVLGMIVAEYLFSLHSHVDEGDLTKMRSWLVNSNSLALCAKKLGLDKKDVMVVGDSIQSDIKGAENAGIKAILMDRNNRRDFKEKITAQPVDEISHQIPKGIEKRLSGRYGALGYEIIRQYDEELFCPIENTKSLWVEIPYAAEHENIGHLSDLLLRRVRGGLLLPKGGINLLDRIETLCRPYLSWDNKKWDKEKKAYIKLWKTCYGPPQKKEP